MNMNSSSGKPALRGWLTPLIILVVSLAAAFIAYPYLPVQIPVHWGLDGTRYAGKEYIYAIALLPALLFVVFRAKYGRR